MKLYFHPLSSFCWKALIALYETGAKFEPQLVDLMSPGGRAAFGELWPLLKMPLLVDGENVVAEASVIVEYVAPQLVPARDVWRMRMLDRVFDLYVNEPVGKIVTDKFRAPGTNDPVGVEQARARIATAYDIIEARIGDPFAIGGAFTLADCAAAPALFYANKLIPLDRHPKSAAYLARLVERPSFARVLREAEPYLRAWSA